MHNGHIFAFKTRFDDRSEQLLVVATLNLKAVLPLLFRLLQRHLEKTLDFTLYPGLLLDLFLAFS